MKWCVPMIATLLVALWPHCSASAPAEVAKDSRANYNLHRAIRQDDEPATPPAPSQQGGEKQAPRGESSNPASMERMQQRMQQRVLKEMFQMDVLPEEETRFVTDEQSNFMTKLYNEVADNHTGELRPRGSGKHTTLLTEKVRSLPVRGAAEVHSDGHWRLTFDSSNLPPASENIIYSTLAVYGRHCQTNWRETAAGRAMKQNGSHKTNVSVYASLMKKEYAVNVDQQRLKFKGTCWRTFNMTAAVRSWQARVKRGMRHFILQQQGYSQLDANDFLYLAGEGNTRNRPVLVIYSGKKVNPPKPSGKSRTRRDTSSVLGKSSARESQKGDPVVTNMRHMDCARRDFKIDFTKSGWHKWIISPREYNAYRCAGACRFPIHSSIRSTLHARLEASAMYHNELSGKFDHLEGSGPCCVPTHHSSISMLFHTKGGGTMISVASKMVAERCGCR